MWIDEDALRKVIVVEETSGGPVLIVGNITVRSWLGTEHNQGAKCLRDEIINEILRHVSISWYGETTNE